MNALRIRRKLDSETLHLPELKPLIGKNVEIIILDETGPAIVPGSGDWDSAIQGISELENYDFDAFRKQREYDLQHAKDHLP
jgi:hypothetical protein